MRIIRALIIAACMVALAGCATSSRTMQRGEDVGRIGCGFVPFAGSLCKEGLRKLTERRQDNMFQVLGDVALTLKTNTPAPWAFERDEGYVIVHSRSEGELDDIGTFFVINISYFHVIDGEIDAVDELTLVAIPNPDANRIDQPAYIYLWR